MLSSGSIPFLLLPDMPTSRESSFAATYRAWPTRLALQAARSWRLHVKMRQAAESGWPDGRLGNKNWNSPYWVERGDSFMLFGRLVTQLHRPK
jgi:hypothetical protein